MFEIVTLLRDFLYLACRLTPMINMTECLDKGCHFQQISSPTEYVVNWLYMHTELVMDTVLNLIKEKDALETKIKDFSLILSNNNIGMNDPLVDSDGFPRSDIDVYQVRHARHEINCLQNDYKEIMKRIEKGLEVVHSQAKDATIDPNGTNVPTPMEDLIAFARINRVDVGSPSEVDGLKVNDEICKFGSISAENFKNVSNVGEVVQLSKNKPVQVIVRRDNKEKSVYLTPRAWSGRGLLGCNIIPIDQPDR